MSDMYSAAEVRPSVNEASGMCKCTFVSSPQVKKKKGGPGIEGRQRRLIFSNFVEIIQ